MTEQEVLKLLDHGEVTKVQFKERIIDAYDVGCEMVAFSNTHGGQLVIGINDKMGVINALSYQEVQETTNLLGNIASEYIARHRDNSRGRWTLGDGYHQRRSQ